MGIFVIRETDKRALFVRPSEKKICYTLFMIPVYKSYRFPSSFSAQDEHQTADKYSQVKKLPKQLKRIVMQTEERAKENHQRVYIMGTLYQSSGGPIAFRLNNLFIFF